MFEQCIYFNSNKLVRKINRIWEKAYMEVALSPAHAYLLRAVLKRPGCRLSDLAENLSLAPSTVTRFVEALVARGLLEKYRGGDGREYRLRPTATALEIKDRLEAIGDSLTRKMCQVIGAAALNDLVETLRETEWKIEK
jgi:DNA-binding MarR family transcriptional regulator